MAYYQHKKPVRQIENYLSENGFDRNIAKKEVKYDWKRGKYAIYVRYKDEPNLEYEFGFDADDNIMVMAFNQMNIAVEDGKRLKENN